MFKTKSGMADRSRAGGRPSKAKQAMNKALREVEEGKQRSMLDMFRKVAGSIQQQQQRPAPAEQAVVVQIASDSDSDDASEESAATMPAAASESVPAEVAAALQQLPTPPETRATYTVEQKQGALKVLEACNGKIKTALRHLKPKAGYAKVDRKRLRNWRDQAAAEAEGKPSAKRGRPINEDFEKAVLGNLIFEELNEIDSNSGALVLANAVYSYANVITAARMAQKAEGSSWEKDSGVQSLAFSNCWVQGFLARHVLHRRRVTAKNKDAIRPSVQDVQAVMSEIQQQIITGEYSLERIISADETGVSFGVQPTHQWVRVPKKARGEQRTEDSLYGSRATAPDADDKARFTCVLWGTAAGELGPPFVIVKCISKGADLRRITVLNKLRSQLNDGNVLGGGWVKEEWNRELELKVKGQMKVIRYYRPYLVHPDSMTIITAQHKAWMDSVGMTMWADTQMASWVGEGKALIVWDNCGPHSVAAVKDVFTSHNISTASLPPNMTDRLQVMDLVVNGPLKAAIRRARSSALLEYFQRFKLVWLQEERKRPSQRKMPAYNPPKPTLFEGIKTVFAACDEVFTKPEFQAGMQRSFVTVGLAPIDEDNGYVKYTGRKIHLPSVLAPADSSASDTYQYSDVVTEVDIVARADASDDEVCDHQSADEDSESESD